MKKLAIAVIMVSVSALEVAAQTAKSNRGGRLLDGDAWMQLSKENRIFYVIGFQEGAVRFASDSKQFDCNCTPRAIANGITEIYNDSENRPMAVVCAWHLFVMKVTDAPEEQIDIETRRARVSCIQ